MRLSWPALLSGLLLIGCSGGPTVVATSAGVGDLFFLDAQKGWMVGEDVKQKKPLVASTLDGGKSWQLQRFEEGPSILVGVAFENVDKGRIYGTHSSAYHTEDGGKTWQRDKALGDANDYSFFRGTHCVSLNGFGTSRHRGVVCFREDPQEQHFQQETRAGWIFHGRRVQVVDRDDCWLTSDTMIFSTHDLGKSWQHFPIPETQSGSTVVNAITASFFLDTQKGWLILEDGTVLRSQDGFATHETLGSQGLKGSRPNQVHFLDSQRGVAIAGPGDLYKQPQILVTSDGGEHWTPKKSLPEGNWGQLFVLDSLHAWVAGTTSAGLVVLPFKPF